MTAVRLASVVVALVALAVAPATASAADRYVAIGDSIAGADASYVDRFGAQLGIADLRKLISGATAVQAVRSELPAAAALIGDPGDTTVVTVQIGGHDLLSGNCDADWNRPTCDYADGLYALLAGLRAALEADPGPERFLLLAYYNPASGRADVLERTMDAGLRGLDGRIDLAAHGADWGMSDVAAWVACRAGATFVDPWTAFKAGGQSLMADPLHPNATGQALLADLLGNPAAGGPTPTCPPTTPFAVTDDDAGDGRAHGVVEPRLTAARWWFEYGRTTTYGRSTPIRTLPPSAGARTVTAALPVSRTTTTLHARLVVENDRGRAVGADRVVTRPQPPELTASAPGRRLRRGILARGVALRISSTGRSVDVRGRLRRHGHDPVVLQARRPWVPGATQTVRVPLTARGRRLVRAATRPQLAITLTARGPGGASSPVRLRLRLR